MRAAVLGGVKLLVLQQEQARKATAAAEVEVKAVDMMDVFIKYDFEGVFKQFCKSIWPLEWRAS